MPNTMHLRKARAKRRKILDPETAMRVEQVKTLCGKWVSPRFTIREDKTRTLTTETAVVICDECKAQRNLSGVFGDKADDDTVPNVRGS